MKIYLIRHSLTESTSPGKKDFDRKLTEEGAKLISGASIGWQSVIDAFDFIVTSPYIRAKQTAEIIRGTFNSAEVTVDNNIGAGGSTRDLITIANSLKADSIAFVGHQPDISNHMSLLLSSGNLDVKFSPATIACISFKGEVRFSSGTLEFLIPAKIIG